MKILLDEFEHQIDETEAMADIEEGKTQKSMFIALAIIEEMADVVSCNADDSDGQIGGLIRSSELN